MKKDRILILLILIISGYFIYKLERQRGEERKYREEVVKEIETLRDSIKIANKKHIKIIDSLQLVNDSLQMKKDQVIIKYKYREKYINSINNADSLRVLLTNRYKSK